MREVDTAGLAAILGSFERMLDRFEPKWWHRKRQRDHCIQYQAEVMKHVGTAVVKWSQMADDDATNPEDMPEATEVAEFDPQNTIRTWK